MPITMPLSLRALPWLLLPCLAACSSSTPSNGADVPRFRDVSEAPAAIQIAAKAVVRIRTADAQATGSFISADGRLLTNNHVLGVEVCPKEGCYAQITRMHQRHATSGTTETIFVVPLAVDVGLDMAIVQAYSTDASGQKGAQLSTPDFLAFDARDPGSLQGEHVHIVGHPEGRLKKWTDGEVVDSSGAWITSTAFTLPGNSGSPILSDDGRIVGILHRGPATQDLLTANGADTYSIGTASGPLVAARASGALPAALLSTVAPITDADLVAREAVFRNAHVASATVGSAVKQVIDSLATACDAGLARQDIASPDDLDQALAACYAAENWIDCNVDRDPSGFSVCPTDVTPWHTRFQGIYDHWRALNGHLDLGPITFSMSQLENSKATGNSAAESNLQAALADARPALDFPIAVYLAVFGVTTFDGANVADFVRNYSKQPHYELSASTIAVASLWLNQGQLLDGDAVRSLLAALAADAKVDIGAKLYIEEIQYNSKIID
jgi:V8-like Glu-specific endopeptidase